MGLVRADGWSSDVSIVSVRSMPQSGKRLSWIHFELTKLYFSYDGEQRSGGARPAVTLGAL